MKRVAIFTVLVVALSGMSLFLVWAIPRGCDAHLGNVPMLVYGKVVDQAGIPVPDAGLEFRALRATRSPFASPMGNDNFVEWRAWATTAADGRFSVQAGNGQELIVQSITKDGYRWQPGADGNFIFMNAGSHATLYKPDSAHPVKFLMWNLAVPKMVTRSASHQMRGGDGGWGMTFADGTFEKTFSPGQIRIAIAKPKPGDLLPCDWEIVIGDVGEEVVEAKGPLGPEAPRSGYVKSVALKVSKSDPAWSDHIVKRFYTRDVREGIYAGAELEARLSPDGGPITVTIRYTANFGKSRDLVPGPVAPAKK
jgi:hypothetical protein